MGASARERGLLGTIDVSAVVEIVDKMTAWYVTVLGTEVSGKGVGTLGGAFGGAKKAEDLEGLGVGTADYDIIAMVGPAFRSLRKASDINALSATYLASSINALSAACSAAGTANEWSGVADLDSFATYHNLTAATKWQCLLLPDFYGAYAAATQRTLSAQNVYYEVLQGTGSDGLGKLVAPCVRGVVPSRDRSSLGPIVGSYPISLRAEQASKQRDRIQ